MRIRIEENDTEYVIWLSADDTYNWANKAGAYWACSGLSDHRLVACIDSNGLCDLTVDGKDANNMDIDSTELEALIGDYLPQRVKHLWPCWDIQPTHKQEEILKNQPTAKDILIILHEELAEATRCQQAWEISKDHNPKARIIYDHHSSNVSILHDILVRLGELS